MVNNNQEFGSSARKTRRTLVRKKRHNTINNEVNALICEHLTELKNAPINESIYELQVQVLITTLKAKYKQLDDYRIARNSLSKEINEGNKLGKHYLSVPPYVIQAKRGAILRNRSWFKNVRLLNEWKFHWCKNLTCTTEQSDPASAEYLLLSSLISAALFGGLCIPEALVALANQLVKEDKPLVAFNDLAWFDLTFQSASQDVNYRLDDDKSSLILRRWYPDSVSLAWINHFLQIKKTHGFQTIKLDQKKCWALIQQHMKNIANVKVASSFKLFCQAAAGVLENYPGVDLPNTLLEYANGKVACASLTPHYQQAILTPTINKIGKIDFKKFELGTNKIRNKNQGINKVDCKFEEKLELIRVALRKKLGNGVKSTPDIALKSLKNIDLSNTPEAMFFMVRWLIYLFEEREVKVSTANTYFSKIGTLWLTYMHEISFAYLDEESFAELYKIMVDSAHTEQSRQDRLMRINDLHAYGVNKFDFPVLTNNQTLPKGKRQNFVRAGFISEAVFHKLCEALKQTSGLDHQEAQGLVCIVILGYRLGLRRGELLKLQINDIEDSRQQWLYVRENMFDNNKTSSSLRKVPIKVLLTQGENNLFSQYFKKRKKLITKSPQSLLFSMSTTPTLPYDGGHIGRLISSNLKALTGLPFTFHHLRHSALSRLHLIIERQDKVLKEMCKYSPEQISAIQQMLLPGYNNSAPRDNYWVLAGIAGHSTPETTFSNYLHLADRVLFERVNRAEVSFSISDIKSVSGISSNFLTRLCKKEQLSPESIPISKLRLKLNDDISPFCQKLRKPKKPIELNNDDSEFLARKIDYKDCLSVLKQVEEGASISELVHEYQISEVIIDRWVEKAKALAKINTAKGKSRLFKEYDTVEKRLLQLCPQKPQTKAELDDAGAAIKKLKSNYHENKSRILCCVDYFINSTTRSSSAIQFKQKKQFEDFMKFIVTIFPKNRWSLYLEVIEHDDYDKRAQIEDWRNISQGIPIIIKEKSLKKQGVFPEGRMSLYLNYPKKEFVASMKDKNKVAEKYSAATLRYVFHILAIML